MDNKRVKPEYRVRHAKVYSVLEQHKGESLRSAEVATAAKLSAKQAVDSLRYLASHGFASVTVEAGDKLYRVSDRVVKTEGDLFKLEKLRQVPVARKREATAPTSGPITVTAGVSVVIRGRRQLLSFKEASALYDALGVALQ